jgi:RHS repeat-associated protein
MTPNSPDDNNVGCQDCFSFFIYHLTFYISWTDPSSSPEMIAGDTPILQQNPGTWYYHINDHLGTCRVVIDHQGQVIRAQDYFPFGLTLRSLNNKKTRFSYTGKELDTAGGLGWFYFGARYYDPGIGRFISVDPLADKYWGWSPYVYGLDNPLSYFDPDGNSPFGVLNKKTKQIYNKNMTYAGNQIKNNTPVALDAAAWISTGLGQPQLGMIFSTGAVLISAQNKEYLDASFGLVTDIGGAISKTKLARILWPSIQLIYDFTTSGKSHKNTFKVFDKLELSNEQPNSSNKDLDIKGKKADNKNSDKSNKSSCKYENKKEKVEDYYD